MTEYEPIGGELLDALLRRGIAFHRATSDPSEITICCPFCADARFRLGINIRKDVMHCFNCGAKSRKATEEISEVLSLGVLIIGQGDLELGEIATEQPRLSLPDDFVRLSEPADDSLTRRALRYLLDRGVETWQIKRKKIGVSFVGRYAYRIVFPVYHGKVLDGLIARDFTGTQEPKYLNSAGARSVYGAPTEKKRSAILCEGIFDCLALERVLQEEDYDVLALLGHTLSGKQEEILSAYEDIVLWPDADVPGIKGFLDVAKQLALWHRIFVVPPSRVAKDAGDSPVEVLVRQWENRVRLNKGIDLRLRAASVFREV
jgi:DNA primase